MRHLKMRFRGVCVCERIAFWAQRDESGPAAKASQVTETRICCPLLSLPLPTTLAGWHFVHYLICSDT